MWDPAALASVAMTYRPDETFAAPMVRLMPLIVDWSTRVDMVPCRSIQIESATQVLFDTIVIVTFAGYHPNMAVWSAFLGVILATFIAIFVWLFVI